MLDLIVKLLYALPGPMRTSEIVIHQPIDVVWDVVTDSGNFADILPGEFWWGPFDRNTVKPGTPFEKSHLRDTEGKRWNYYVVDWRPPVRFSMGNDARRWAFDFRLAPVNEHGTRLRFSRRLNASGWIAPYRGLMERTTAAVARKCDERNRSTSQV